MNNSDYELSIEPLTSTTAKLVRIDGKIDINNYFEVSPNYQGYNSYKSPSKIIIDKWIYNNKEYIITEICNCSFSHCTNIVEIVIGENVNKISWNMYHCPKLQKITVHPNNKTFHSIDGVLFKKNKLVGFPLGRVGKYKIPTGTTHIGHFAFKSAAINQIIFPDSIIEIGRNAFYECNNIKEFIIPRSIKRVYFNNNINGKPISQTFYFKDDIMKSHPMKIEDLIKYSFHDS